LSTCNNQFNPHQCATVISIVAVLLIASVVLVWSAASRQNEYLQSQHNLVENSVMGAANQISNEIEELRQSIRLFAAKEQKTIKLIVKHPKDTGLYDNFLRSVKSEYPDAVSFAVANKDGDLYVQDFGSSPQAACRSDIKQFAKAYRAPDIFIHSSPIAYHFDIMIKQDIGLNEDSIFVVSLMPQVISKIVNNSELYSHKLYLIQKDSKGLVEITSRGSRDILGADNNYLNENQLSQILQSYPVNDTLWDIVDIPIDSGVTNYIKGIWMSTIAAILFMCTLSCFLILALNRSEKTAKQHTEQAMLDKIAAEFANKAKSNFLANMSHEIRTPLTAIIGYGETLLRSDQTMKERVDAVNTIISSGEHLLGLINDILDVSKIEADKLVLDQVKESPFKLLDEVKRIMSGQALKKGLEFSIHYNFPLPKYIYSDYLRIKQILINLCSNAIKFTNNGSVTVTMSYDATTDRLFFVVKDTGIGISNESQLKIFDSFTQADSSITRKYGGTGLGLTLSKQLARLLRGDITLVSKPEVGSSFTFYISTNLKNSSNLIQDESGIPVQSRPMENYYCLEKLYGRVLVAEDNEINRKLIIMFLQKMGLNATGVDSGEKAVNSALTSHYDVVFMDMQMPVMSGLDAIKTLRGRGYKQPIVVLTANALQEDKEVSYQAGCNDFVTKPIHYEQLYRVTKKYTSVAAIRVNDEPLYSELADDPEYRDLLVNFIDSLPVTEYKLKSAHRNNDWNLLSELIHQLKGAGGGYGFPQLSDLAAKIEFQLVNQDQLQVMQLLESLYEMFSRVISGLQNARDNNKRLAQ